jgi:hypothetical protein
MVQVMNHEEDRRAEDDEQTTYRRIAPLTL